MSEGSTNGNSRPAVAEGSAGKEILEIKVIVTDLDKVVLHIPGQPRTPFDKYLLVGVLQRAVMEMMSVQISDPAAVSVASASAMNELEAYLKARGGK